MFKYKLENPQELVPRIVDYSFKARRDGILSLEGDIVSEENDFLRDMLSEFIDGLDAEYVEFKARKLIKYYIAESFFFTRKKQYDVEKQMEMVLDTMLLLQDGNNPRKLEKLMLSYYPNKKIKSRFD